MTITMNTTKLTIEQIRNFLKGTDTIAVAVGETIETRYRPNSQAIVLFV
jgi:hypothetical protein